MSDYTTNFPPQTYSSSFYINSLVDGEKSTIFTKTNNSGRDGTKAAPLLDCFISAMSKAHVKIQKLVCLCLLLPFLRTDGVLVCKVDTSSKIVTFPSLLEFQLSTSSFDPSAPTYRGNIVEFTFSSIDRLERNAFISFGSHGIIKISLNAKGIRSVDGGAFSTLFCLHHLELSRNNISTLTTDVFKDLINLRTLDLSENVLQRISENGMVFRKMHKLEALNLSRNRIATLNSFDFFNLTSLQLLDLSFNKISVIPQDLFNSLYSLTNLFLNSNNLMDIEPEKWKNLNHLDELNVAGNYLRKFDPAYNFSFVNLKTLNLSKNSLSYLNVFELRRSLPTLNVIDISVNDWFCNDLESIKHYLADSRITVAASVNCSTSKEYKHPTTTEIPSSTSNSATTSRTTENYVSSKYLKEVFVQSDETLSTTKSILSNVHKLQTLLGLLCTVLVVFVLINITVRAGLCQSLYNRVVNRSHGGDGNDRVHLLSSP